MQRPKYVMTTREKDFPCPDDNFFKYINSFAPCYEKLFSFPFDRNLDITLLTLLELTNQTERLKVKTRFQKIINGKTHIWGDVSLRSSSLDEK